MLLLLWGAAGTARAAALPAIRAEVVRAIVLAQTPDIPVIRNAGQFADLPIGHPFEAYFLFAEQRNIIHATPQRRLLPFAAVSRAELIVMLARAYDLQAGAPHAFEDVPNNTWYEPFAAIASTYRLFRLEQPQRLEPEKPVTMEEVDRALLLVTALQANNIGPIRIDMPEPLRPAATPPVLYTVTSIRRQKVTFVHPETKIRAPLVRRTVLTRPITIEEKRTIILNMINAIRHTNGLQPFTPSTQLETSAQNYADRMVRDGFFAHITPDGQNVQERIDATGFTDKSYRQECLCFPGYALGENLAKGQKTAEEAVNDWMKSPEHKAAILNPRYTHTGIGLNAGIWVEHFGGMVVP